MIPMIMSLEVQNRDNRRVRLFFPAIIVWIIALALLIAILPFMLIAALVTIPHGPGKRLLLLYPVFFKIVFAASGLRVDVATRMNHSVRIAFE
jgi:hypothetical protein